MDIKILYTNGCRFSQGDIHPNLPEQLPHNFPPYDEKPWPDVIAEKFKLNLVNEATSGISNFRIVRTTLDWFRNFRYDGGDTWKKLNQTKKLLITESKIRGRTVPPIIDKDKLNKFRVLLNEEKIDISQVFVIIGWTSLDRWEYFDDDEWKRVMVNPGLSIDPYSKNYYKYYYDQDAARLDYENQVTLLGSFFKNIGVSFLFFNSLPIYSFSYTKPISVFPWHGHNKNLFIEDKYIFSQSEVGENFLEYLESIDGSQTQYEERINSKDSVWLLEDPHPSDKGHEIWANKLIEHIEKHELMND